MDIRTQVTTNYGDHLERFGALWRTQLESLKSKFQGSIVSAHFPGEDCTDVLTVVVKRDALLSVLEFLKQETGFQYNFLSDLTATDEGDNPRFLMVYNLFAHESKARIRVKTPIAENEECPSATQLWAGANWAEREVWDMYGIRFSGHPNMRRILMDERWQGHPLRKDYPLRGYQVFFEPEPIHEELLK